jgi:hypothetical protein
VAQYPELRKSLPPLLIALILLAFAATGLAAGVGARRLVDAVAGYSSSGLLGRGGLTTHTVTPPTPSPTATTEPTAVVAPGGDGTGFSLNASVSPAEVTASQPFTVTVTVIASDASTLLSGVPCTLGPGAGVDLFGPGRWPPMMLSSRKGTAIWQLVAPNVAPGIYIMQIRATGTHGYYTYVDFTLHIGA